MSRIDDILENYIMPAHMHNGIDKRADAKSELLQVLLEVVDKQTFQMLLQLHNQEHLNGGYIYAVDLTDEIKELFGVEE